MTQYQWNYTLSKKKNVLLYLKSFLPVFFAITATMTVFFLIKWVNWWQALIFALFYLIPLFCLFLITALKRPTYYSVDNKGVEVTKGSEFRSLPYSKIKAVILKKKRKSADILFKLKKGLTIHCQFKSIENIDSAIEVYNFIKEKTEKTVD